MNLSSGLLNQRVTIYSSNVIILASGGVDPNNAPYWSTVAEVRQLRSSRNAQANQEVLKQVFQFKIRYRRDKNIANNMMLYWRGSWFIISGYTPDVVYNDYVIFDAIANNMGNIVTT